MAKTSTKISAEGDFNINGSLWLAKGKKRFFGPGPVELLQYIEETGSITKAAKKMRMSYKKAWEIVHNLNAATAKPLIITATGGEKGGGSVISEEAKKLIDYHSLLRERFGKFLQSETVRLAKILK